MCSRTYRVARPARSRVPSARMTWTARAHAAASSGVIGGDITIRVNTERELQAALAALASVSGNPALPPPASNGGIDPVAANLLDETPTEPLEDRFFQSAES